MGVALLDDERQPFVKLKDLSPAKTREKEKREEKRERKEKRKREEEKRSSRQKMKEYVAAPARLLTRRPDK